MARDRRVTTERESLKDRFGAASSDDIAFGQYVIVTARWILVAAGLIFALWNPESINALRIEIVVILLLAVGNFYLHAQLLMRRPAVDSVAYLASAGDITVITLLILSQGGFASDLYIFYFPALLALAVAFGRFATMVYGTVTVLVYGLIAASTAPADSAQVIVTRLLMLAAVAICGSMYWRIERTRREAAAEAQRSLLAQLGERGRA